MSDQHDVTTLRLGEFWSQRVRSTMVNFATHAPRSPGMKCTSEDVQAYLELETMLTAFIAEYEATYKVARSHIQRVEDLKRALLRTKKLTERHQNTIAELNEELVLMEIDNEDDIGFIENQLRNRITAATEQKLANTHKPNVNAVTVLEKAAQMARNVQREMGTKIAVLEDALEKAVKDIAETSDCMDCWEDEYVARVQAAYGNRSLNKGKGISPEPTGQA